MSHEIVVVPVKNGTTADADFDRAKEQAKKGDLQSTPVFNPTTDDSRYAGYERYPSKR